MLSCALADPPSRHELDELFSLTCVEALAGGWLVLTNPLPAEALPLELYGDLLRDVRGAGCRTLVDLSSPRLDSALQGEPDLVKVNDWELAEFVRGPGVGAGSAARRGRAAAGAGSEGRGRHPRRAAGAGGDRGATPGGSRPPLLTSGFREGCGDAMLGALAGSWAPWRELRGGASDGSGGGRRELPAQGPCGQLARGDRATAGGRRPGARLGTLRNRLAAQHSDRRARSLDHSSCSPLTARASHSKPSLRRRGRPAREEWESLPRRCTSPSRASAPTGPSCGLSARNRAVHWNRAPAPARARSRSRRSAPAWRSGCASTVRVPLAASCSTSAWSPSPSGPGDGSSSTHPPSPS